MYNLLPGTALNPVLLQWERIRQMDRRKLVICTGVASFLLLAILFLLPDRSSQQVMPITANAPYYRDITPFRTMHDFWQQSIREIQARGLDTCGDKLGAALIEAHYRTRMEYCAPTSGDTQIFCTAVKHDDVSAWWPVPSAPCVSRKLRGDERSWSRHGCNITEEGIELDEEMRSERFLGTGLGDAQEECVENIKRTLLVIPRQDQWNPFHNAEDVVTMLVSTFIALIGGVSADQPVQVVFDDDFGLEGNHFVAMWDKIGAWPPRRLSLDPWRKACFETVVHSVGAGVSILTAQNVRDGHPCASSITWAASHYVRRLFRLSSHRGVNVLWLSRDKYEEWAMRHSQWDTWRSARRLENEQQLVDRIKEGLSGMGHLLDEDETPGYWSTDRDEIRFASIDPSVHSLDTQVHLVGHADILLSMHGGALGLMMFMPPGKGSVIELTVTETAGSKHFEVMTSQLGRRYDRLHIERWVDVDSVWNVLQSHVSSYLR